LHEIVEIPGGDAERPLSTTSLECKFKKFAIPVIGSAAAEQIVSLVNGLDHLPDTRELTHSAKGEGKQTGFDIRQWAPRAGLDPRRIERFRYCNVRIRERRNRPR
jgi:hypothetical protein